MISGANYNVVPLLVEEQLPEFDLRDFVKILSAVAYHYQ